MTDSDFLARVFAAHQGGKMQISATSPLRDEHDLALLYTPGVAAVSSEIANNPVRVNELTWVGNTVAVVSDGTAVLGLGDVGPAAAMPVMEGKAVLFKQFGEVDAIPICLSTTDTDAIIEAIAAIAPSFGGINLEDISAPRCFEIEQRLIERLDIPVFHDDQHGTAVVVLAALQNALRLVGKKISTIKVVISGAGAAGVAITNILLAAGVRNIQVVDRVGIVCNERTDLNPVKKTLAQATREWAKPGSVGDALRDADVFIGVSGGTIPEEFIASMDEDSIVFALANPIPEVDPEVAARHARVFATGRSDYPNQINNVLVFPGIFRGALDVRATRISEGMKLAAATAIAGLVSSDLSETYIIPSPFDPRVAKAVANAVIEAAHLEGLAREEPKPTAH